MAVNDRLSDLLVDWEQSRRGGVEPSLEELCRETPELLPVLRESIDSLRATAWMLEPQPSEPSVRAADPAAFNDTELPASHLTAQEFAASIFQSGLLSKDEIGELKQRLHASDLPGEAREIASKLVTEGKLTRYQAAVLLKASKDPLLIDNYVILDTLDTGGMGLVFKALHRSMNRVVALKLLPAAMIGAHDTVKRFQREVQAAAALKHPNVVAAYDADESDEIAYLVLEYVEGTNLYRLVKDQGPRSLTEAADYVCQAARGLAYLHSRGIIHRDVKPANLILAHDGTVKLLDMGLVRFASSEDLSCSEMDQELTQAGIVIGTVAYMSPEQALDTRSADQRSDIYSLGCTLFYLLTGRSLYHEETGMKTLLAHREQPVPSIREFCEEAPVSLDAVFRTMVAKRPADRLQSMEEILAAIEACVPGLTPSGERIARGMSDSFRSTKIVGPKRIWQSRKWRVGAIASAVAAAVIASVYLAVVLIRIRTNHGTIEISTNDPNPKVEIVDQPQTSSAQAIPLATEQKAATEGVGVYETNPLPTDDPNLVVVYRMELVASTTAGNRAALASLFIGAENKKISEALSSVVKSAGADDLKNPGLARFEERLTTAINQVVPHDYVRNVHPIHIQAQNTRVFGSEPSRSAETSQRKTTTVAVVTATVRKGDFPIYLTGLYGSLTPSQIVHIRPRVDGEIMKVYFKGGQAVKAGDLLFDIDPRPYEAKVDEERAQMRRDEASLSEAVKALARGEKLVQSHSISAEEVGSRTAAVEQAKGAIQKDKARTADAMLQLAFCHIQAPIDGRIGLRIVEKGNVVRAAGNTSLAEIVQVRPIDLIFSIPQSDVEAVQQRLITGKETSVEILNNTSAPIATGKLTGLDNAVEPASQSLRAKARFANDDNRLYPGQNARVQLLVDTLNNAVIVPLSAVQGTFAFVVKPDQTVEKRKLVTGPSEKAETVVTSGLSAGEIVVIQGTDKLVDGSRIRTSNDRTSKSDREGHAVVTDKSSGNTTAIPNKVQVPRMGGTKGPTFPSRVPEPPPAGSSDRVWAEWLFRNFKVRITTDIGPDIWFSKSDDLPPIEFHITRIEIAGHLPWPTDSLIARLDATIVRRLAELPSLVGLSLLDSVARVYESAGVEVRIPDNVTNDVLPALGEMKRLSSLQVTSLGLNDDNLKHLATLTNLTALDLSGCRNLHGGGLTALIELKKLRGLDLSETGVDDKGLSHVAQFPELGTLSLAGTWVSSPAISQLSSLSQLRDLVLYQCRRIDDEALPAIAKLKSLRHLNIDQTRVTAEAVVRLQEQLPKCQLRLSNEIQESVNSLRSGKHNRWLQLQTNSIVEPANPIPKIATKPANAAAEKATAEIMPSEQELIARMNAESSHDRAIARWVFACHGRMVVIEKDDESVVQHAVTQLIRVYHGQVFAANDIGRWVYKEDAIPTGDFHIVGIYFGEPRKRTEHLSSPKVASNRVLIPDAVAGRLAKLHDLAFMNFDCVECNDATLKAISGLKRLQILVLKRTSVTDAGMQWLRSFSNLRMLDLRDSAITDKGLQTLANNKLFAGLRDEQLAEAVDEALPPSLWLDRTRTTEAGIVAFQESAPNSEVFAAAVLGVRTNPDNPREVPVPLPPGPHGADRAWSEWLFTHLNGCSIRTDVDPDTPVSTIENLPPIDFRITQIGFFRQPDAVGATAPLNPFVIRRLAELPALESLSFKPAYEDWFPAIATLTRLKSLSVESGSFFNIGDDAVKAIGGMTNLTSLRIESDRLTDASLKDLARLIELTTLELTGNRYVHGNGLKELGGLKKLKFLNLAGSAVDDEGLANVSGIPSLEILELKGTWISGKGLLGLSRLPRLAALDLSYCRRIDATIFTSLRDVKSLRQLWVGHSRITQELAAEYQGSLANCRVLWNADIARELERERQIAAATPRLTVRPDSNPAGRRESSRRERSGK